MMKAIAHKAFIAARKRLRDCKAQMHSVVAAEELPDDSMKEDYLESEGRALAHQIEQLFATIVMIHEGLEQTRSLAAFEEKFAPIRDKLNVVEYFDGDRDMAFSPGIDYLDDQLNLLAPLFDIPPSVEVERRILWNILEQTNVLMARQPTLPKREKDVQDALEHALAMPFPDTIREAGIAKQSKSYHPDFGVESLGTAIEVKFVDKAADVGKAIGQLYEDMGGYAGSPSWVQFMGVLYMTGSFTSQKRVNAELKKANCPKNWKVCVVAGVGGSPKAKKSAQK
jgi:hypothetical protein